MPRFDAVLLDYGNTVVQFDRPQIEWIHGRLAPVLSQLVAPIEPQRLGEVMDRVCVLAPLSDDKREVTALEQVEHVLREAYGDGFPVTPEIVSEADREYQELFVRTIEIDERARQTLHDLHGRVRLGLVSNYPCGVSLRRSLESIGIADLFQAVVVSGEVGFVKPHPKVFQVALGAMGVAAERVLFVGDSWASDMVGAHAAGMVTCHHLGHTSDTDCEDRYDSYRPDFAITHLGELEEIVSGDVAARR